jgi:hypothetical protein
MRRGEGAGLAWAAALIGLAACSCTLDDAALYDRAIVDAAVKKPDRIHELTPIADERIVVAAWVRAGSALDTEATALRTSRHNRTWVTIAAQIRAACRRMEPSALIRRVEQLLGLPPGYGTNRRMATFTVERAFLARPCADPSTTTTSCSIQAVDAPADPSQREGFDAHGRWLAGHMLASYRIETPGGQGYPFTGLGYTYDWHPDNERHIGLPEYVVLPDTAVTGVRAADIATFCAE